MDNKQLVIPGAIVIAGLLIAGAIVATNKKPSSTDTGTTVTLPALEMKAVSVDDHIRGDIKAPITLVEYSDTECPYCKNYQNTLQSIVSDYVDTGKVAWVYRHYPLLQLHPKAFKEAEATECAYAQGGEAAFWKYIDEVYNQTPSNNKLDPAVLTTIAKDQGLDMTAFNSCLTTETYKTKVQDSMSEGQKLGINGTPHSFILTKDAITDTQLAAIKAIFQKINATDYLTVYDGNHTLGMGGAMPEIVVRGVLEILLKQN